ncbi:hypothetical protein GCM10017600_10100 [Streptosporangium carneum]|uniref:Uncharacterized protein n=1 Tax=Streptosporangium carneum TaxID=47481 RepID=A0A9W6HWF2_9ACTN|nr:hypothetical protein GCM10017600_10100 [Streptosporangium carneum]
MPRLLDAEAAQAGEAPDGEKFVLHAVMLDSPTVGESNAALVSPEVALLLVETPSRECRSGRGASRS